MNITYALSDQGRNRTINYGQYQKHGPGNINNSLTTLNDQIVLSDKDREKADRFTKEALKILRFGTAKQIDNNPQKTRAGLDYYI